MALCVSATTASSSLRVLAVAASGEFCGSTRLCFNFVARGRTSRGVQVLRCVKSSEATGGKRIYSEEEAAQLNRFLSEDGGDGNGARSKEGFAAEFEEEGVSGRDNIEVEVIGHDIEDGGGEENDYWSRNEAGPSSETTVIYPQAHQRVEDDLLKRIRYQNGREIFEERAYLVGIERKGGGPRSSFGITESLEELAQLADTAGLTVVGTTYQK